MFSLTIKSIRANKARFLLTGVAVMLGVAFMAGTLVLTDTIKKSYDNVAANVYKSTDAVVRSARHVEERRATATSGARSTRRRSQPVRAVPGRASGRGAAGRRRRRRRPRRRAARRQPATGRSRSRSAGRTTPALNPMELVSGHAPRAPDEIVIDRASPTKGHFAVGETVHVVSQVGSQRVPPRRCRDLRRRRQRRRRPGRGVRAGDRGDGARYARSLHRDPGRRRARRVAGSRSSPTSAPRCTTRTPK